MKHFITKILASILLLATTITAAMAGPLYSYYYDEDLNNRYPDTEGISYVSREKYSHSGYYQQTDTPSCISEKSFSGLTYNCTATYVGTVVKKNTQGDPERKYDLYKIKKSLAAPGITTNKSNIAMNKSNIITNTTDIATNASNIATNTNDIATNASNIATNTNDIATNASNIATNTNDIATNASNIATNTNDIATNASNIATNTNDIATNASNFTNLAEELEQTFGGNAQIDANGTIDFTNIGGTGKDNIDDAIKYVNNTAIQNASDIRVLYSEVDRVDREAKAGIAAATAIGMLATTQAAPEVGGASWGISTAIHSDQTAVAAGMSAVSDNGLVITKFGVAVDSQENVTAGVSVNWRMW